MRILFEHALSIHDKVDKTRLSPIGYYDSSELAHLDSEYIKIHLNKAIVLYQL